MKKKNLKNNKKFHKINKFRFKKYFNNFYNTILIYIIIKFKFKNIIINKLKIKNIIEIFNNKNN